MSVLNKLESLLGNLVILMLYCSSLFILQAFSGHYQATVVEELSYQFIQDIKETGLTESDYTGFVASVASFGYTVELSLEGTERAYTDKEIRTIIQTEVIEITQKDFITCTVSSKGKVLR